MGAKSNIISVLFISILIDFLEFTIILPLLPKILTYYGSGIGPDHVRWWIKNVSYFYFLHLKDALYAKTMSLVQFIRDLSGTPNDAKWNSVLFGGML